MGIAVLVVALVVWMWLGEIADGGTISAVRQHKTGLRQAYTYYELITPFLASDGVTETDCDTLYYTGSCSTQVIETRGWGCAAYWMRLTSLTGEDSSDVKVEIWTSPTASVGDFAEPRDFDDLYISFSDTTTTGESGYLIFPPLPYNMLVFTGNTGNDSVAVELKLYGVTP